MVLIGSLAILVAAARVEAHPLHTSFTDVTRDASTGVVSVSVRLFADDFGAMIDSLRALPALRNLTTDQVAKAYFRRSFSLSSGDGPVELEWAGMRTVDGLAWISARSPVAVPKGKIRIRNSLMFDRFSDQVSIVRWNGRRGARTVVLSARTPEALVD
jgi:hypothetical protein